VKGALLRAAETLGVGAFLAWRNRRRLPILMYHGLVERPLVPFCWHMLDIAAFTAQLEWTARHYRVLPLGEALTKLSEGTLPPRSCALTFDDGYLNNRTLALPVLQRLGLPATVFVVTEMLGTGRALWPDRLYLAFAHARASSVDLAALGKGTRALLTPGDRARAYSSTVNALKAVPPAEKDRHLEAIVRALDPSDADDPGPFRLMGWEDVRALGATGLVAFGGHTTHHEILRHQGDAEVAHEVRASHARVARETGSTPTVFAYPNGRAIDFDARAQAAVRAAGIPFALTTETGLNDRGTDPLALERVCIGADLPLARFRLLLRGL
jgi:peptidoglycan/xylan/chitin deacetylase (PgdA/CDA1 family)